MIILQKLNSILIYVGLHLKKIYGGRGVRAPPEGKCCLGPQLRGADSADDPSIGGAFEGKKERKVGNPAEFYNA